MEYHVLRWTNSPSEDQLSVSNYPHSHQLIYQSTSWATITTSAQAPLCWSSEAYNGKLWMPKWSLEATMMWDYLTHLQMYPAGHAWLPRPLADLSSLSDPMALAGLMEPTTHSSYSLSHILSYNPVTVIWPHYIYRSPHVHPSTYATQLLDPMVWRTWHLKDHMVWTEPLSSVLRCSCPAQVYNTCLWHMFHKKDLPTIRLTLILLQHMPTTSCHGCYDQTYARGLPSTSPYDGVEELGWDWGEREVQDWGTRRG